MIAMHFLAVALAVLLLAYLFAALFKPEWF